jgi:hypothetical protein
MAVLYGRIGGAWVPISSSMDNEVVIGPDDPITSYPTAELWYDTDAVTLPVTGFVPTAGGTMTGDLTIDPANLNFGATIRQMVNLYGTPPNSYGIGVQTSTLYQRTSSAGNFAWYRGGVHSDVASDPGAGGTLLALLAGSGLFVGKPSSDLTAPGVEVLPSGRIYSTTDTAVSVNSVFNINAAVAGNVYASFRRSNTQIGSVTNATATSVAYNTTSDRRLKRIIGPVADAAERVRRLKVWHFAWKTDDIEQDGLIADEVQSVVPIAVTGEPDAVDDDGEIVAQQMDYSKLVPLLTAALQAALDRIDTLEQRIDVLEAA